jgi:hypothetical protein
MKLNALESAGKMTAAFTAMLLSATSQSLDMYHDAMQPRHAAQPVVAPGKDDGG